MVDALLTMLVLVLAPLSLYVVPTLIARRLIEPDRRWSSDAPLLFVFFALWLFSLTLRQAGFFNWLMEPALLTAAPIAFWLLSNHRLVSGPAIADHRIGPQPLLLLVGASVLNSQGHQSHGASSFT